MMPGGEALMTEWGLLKPYVELVFVSEATTGTKRGAYALTGGNLPECRHHLSHHLKPLRQLQRGKVGGMRFEDND